MGLKRNPPADNSRRVRSSGQNICGVITNKAGRTVQFESFAERCLLLRLERLKTVQDYISQPEALLYTDEGGKWHSYTPDFLVWHTDERTSLHEVSLSKRLSLPALEQRHAAAQQICKERGWTFHIHTEQDLPQGSELANLLALWMYRAQRYADGLLLKNLQQALHSENKLHPLVMSMHQQQQIPIAQIASSLYHYLWHGEIEMDWQQLLFQDAIPNPDTRLCLPQKAGATWQS